MFWNRQKLMALYTYWSQTQKKMTRECLILKDMSSAEDADSVYEVVEDDTELLAVSKVFEELLEDVDIEM